MSVSRLSNTLDFHLRFSVAHDRVELAALECERLPWVADPELMLRTVAAGEMLPSLDAASATREGFCSAIRNTSEKLRSLLEEEYGICCEVHLHLLFEEQCMEAMAPLLAKLAGDDESAPLDSAGLPPQVGRMLVKKVRGVALENAQKALADDLEIADEELELLPGRSFALSIKAKKPLICTDIRLLSGGHEVARSSTTMQLEAGEPRSATFSGISAKNIQRLAQSGSSALSVRVRLEGREKAMALPAKVHHRELIAPGELVSLFLDVGSTTSKYLEVDAKADTTNEATVAGPPVERLSDGLRRACNGGKNAHVGADEVTEAFIVSRGLPQLTKALLDSHTDQELAGYFVEAIRGQATQYYRRENRLIADLYWAFPDTRGRSFAQIDELVNRRLEGAILGRAYIVPEAKCLRAQFRGALDELARGAKLAAVAVETGKKKKLDDESRQRLIHNAWKTFQDAPWYRRIWRTITHDAPLDPQRYAPSNEEIPTLEQWHEEFLQLEIDAGLSDFLVIDAGGYSLDVYGSFSKQHGFEIARSFPAGGAVINARIIENMEPSKREAADEKELWQEAKDIKHRVCSAPQEEDYYYEVCKKATEEIYGASIESVFCEISSLGGFKGFPIIMTGGGSQNQFLRRLVLERMENAGLAMVPVNTPQLYGTLKGAQMDLTAEVELFLCMASAFHPEDDIPRLAPFTDIVGGLAQMALAKN